MFHLSGNIHNQSKNHNSEKVPSSKGRLMLSKMFLNSSSRSKRSSISTALTMIVVYCKTNDENFYSVNLVIPNKKEPQWKNSKCMYRG